MSGKKTIAIVGATGTQGGSVARTFLSLSPTWTVRCITRDATSTSALDLASLGAELITASLDDLDSLKEAFQGANVIFVNTDFWQTYFSLVPSKGKEAAREVAMETEIGHAKNAADAALCDETLERYIYSALGPMKRASKGKYPCSSHWETKAAAVDYVENEMPALAAKSSFIYASCYHNNSLLFPQKTDPHSGIYQLLINASASCRMPVIDASASIGPFVHAILSEPARTKLLAYDAYVSLAEAVEVWEKVTGEAAEIMELTTEEMQKRTGMSLEVLDAPAFVDEYGYMGGIRGWIGPDQLKHRPKTQTYEKLLRKQDRDALLNAKFFIA